MVKWFDGAGLEKEPEIEQIRRMGVVGQDGVHLSGDYCKRAAVYLCSRMSAQEVVLGMEMYLDILVVLVSVLCHNHYQSWPST